MLFENAQGMLHEGMNWLRTNLSTDLFFKNWEGLLRTLVVGVPTYFLLVLFLRISGKRTLSKMNAFDLVITVSLGSTLATILLNKSVSLAEGTLAFALLIALQYIVAWLSVRSKVWQQLIKSEPRLLLYRGQFLEAALRRERVTRDEVRAAVRSKGVAGLEAVDAVVMETDGTLSIVQRHDGHPLTAMEGVNSSVQLT